MSKDKPFVVDPGNEFRNAVKKAQKDLKDLTIPLKEMTREWFKGNLGIFDLSRQGPGQYKDLSDNYKLAKFKAVKFVYPILVRKGALMRSMTKPDDSGSVNVIINKKILILGTKVKNKKGVPYPIIMQAGSPSRNIPARPFVLIGGERTAPFKINQRRKNWIKILEDYTLQVSKFAERK